VRTRFAGLSELEVEQLLNWLAEVRDAVLDGAGIERSETVVDVGAGTGLLTIGAAERVGADGDVLAIDQSVDALEELQRSTRVPNISYLVGFAEVLPLPDEHVDVVVMRSVLIYVHDKAEAAREAFRVLRPGGRISLFEPINSRNARLADLIDFGDHARAVASWEGECYAAPHDAMVNFDERDLERSFTEAEFVELIASLRETEQEMTSEQVLTAVGAPGRKSLLEEWAEAFSAAEVDSLAAAVRARPSYRTRWAGVYLTARKPG
jgi:arsenite methyltransferase